MVKLQGLLLQLAVLILVPVHHVSSRATCKSPKRYLDQDRQCVRCPAEPDCPEGFFKSRTCGYGLQTECLLCLNCTRVYRTEWKPCTATSQTACGDCIPGFVAFMGMCVRETAWESTSFSHIWTHESSVEEVVTTGAMTTTTFRTTVLPEVALADAATLHLPIFIGVPTAVLFFFVVGFASFRLRKARSADGANVTDCERSLRADDAPGCDCNNERASPTDGLSTDFIPTLNGKQLSTDSGCDVSWSHQDNGSLDSGNPPSPTEIVQSPLHFSYTTEGSTLNAPDISEWLGRSSKSKVWVDIAQARLGENGGCLRLPALGAYLCIDSVGRDTDIGLAVLNSPRYLPPLAKGESLVSPVISCSPHGASFRNPALLSLPHCGDVTSSDVTLVVSETSLDEAPKWREVSMDGSCGVSYMMKGGDRECLVYTSHFTLFGLKAKAKQVKITIFSRLVTDRFFEIHVFCVNDTPESLSLVEKQERENGFHPTCPQKEMTFLSNEKDVKVKMSLNSAGWEMLTQHKQVIGYTSVQQNSNPQGQHVTFHLRAVSENTCASVHVAASQKSNSSSADFDFSLSLVSSTSEQDHPFDRTRGALSPSVIDRFLSVDQPPSPATFLYHLTGGNSKFQPNAISQDLQEKLMRLDEKLATGNDFRRFAEELGFDYSETIRLDQRFDSPTHCLLMYMELRGLKRQQTSSQILEDLAKILTTIGRSDLAVLVESKVNDRPQSIVSNSTDDSGLGPPSPSTGSQLSIATSSSASDIASSTFSKSHLFDEESETSRLLEGNHQDLPNTVVYPAKHSKQDYKNKVETEV
ncbi:uncharacterized protein LOC144917496 [Branchiostoma floridae x Branchiostoma belcheri]